MDVVNAADPVEWLERAGPLLLGDEARHNLILGLAGTLRDQPGFYPDFGLWVVEDAGEPVAAALRTRPYNLVLAQGSEAAIELLACSLDEELPGVVGARPEVDVFVSARGVPATVQVQQGIYALSDLIAPPQPLGAPRAAAIADRPLLLEWVNAFAAEALVGEPLDEERTARMTDHRLTSTSAGFALWEDGGEPVSLVGWGGPTPTGIRIGPVYTPPEHRGRGYASALTAHVSAEQLAAGRSFCFLYTDLANPTSNKIYVAIGYERVCDSVEYAFA
jgi:uncharacterized protein